VLLIEDHLALCKLISTTCQEHFIIDCANNLAKAYYFLDTQTYDLLLVDMHLPDGSGLCIVEYLRENQLSLPILFMTADQDHLIKLDCLKKGADVLMKPFDTEELLLRCRHLLSGEKTKNISQSFPKQLSLDCQLRRVFHHGEWLELNCKEFLLMEALLAYPSQAVSREVLLSRAWVDNDKALFSNSLETYIASLRRKLGKNMIKTVRGSGYALIPEK